MPFGKKKTISDSQWQQAAAQGHQDSSAGSGSGSTHRSLFPDISPTAGNMTKAAANGFNAQQVHSMGSVLRDPTKLAGNHYTMADNNRHSPVPLLTLPGNLVTPSMLAPTYGSSNSARKNESKGSMHLPQISGRSDSNTGRVAAGASELGSYDNNSAFQQVQILPSQGLEKKKKNKSKVPKVPTQSGQSNGVGYSISSARSQGEETENDHSGNSGNYGISGVAESKAATQEFAGPLEDWGFEEGVAAPPPRGKHRPELEYSDDEDFESAEAIIHSSQYKSNDGPYPPAYGNEGNGGQRKTGKKKKKSQPSGSGGDDKPSSTFLPPI